MNAAHATNPSEIFKLGLLAGIAIIGAGSSGAVDFPQVGQVSVPPSAPIGCALTRPTAPASLPPGPTVTDLELDEHGPSFVSCGSLGQQCNEPFSVELETAGALWVNYLVPEAHCSAIAVCFLVDGQPVHTTTMLGWQGAQGLFSTLPLQSGAVDLGPLEPGKHILQVRAVGEHVGCNHGRMASWVVQLEVWTAPLH